MGRIETEVNSTSNDIVASLLNGFAKADKVETIEQLLASLEDRGLRRDVGFL